MRQGLSPRRGRGRLNTAAVVLTATWQAPSIAEIQQDGHIDVEADE